MKRLNDLKSPCVCTRNFSWRRILKPNKEKNDPRKWIVTFGPGLGDTQFETWCDFVAAGLFDSEHWGVLIVTTEPPEAQLLAERYTQFDCRYVRVLSDVSARVGPNFLVEASEGKYPFAICYVQDGKVEAYGRFNTYQSFGKYYPD